MITQSLRLQGRMDLDGTHECWLLTTDVMLRDWFDQAGRSRILKLSVGDRSCGVIIDRVELSGSDILEVDGLKLRHLGVRDGFSVDVEIVEPATAEGITLQAPSETPLLDLKALYGKPVIAGEETAIFNLAGQANPIRISATLPAGGIVRIDAQTKLITEQGTVDGINESYGAIGGLDSEIRQIREIIEYPLRYPQLFERLGIRQPRGVILYGPPGTGKTLILRALAAEAGAAILQISGPEVFSMYIGESERQLREIFRDARAKAPSLVVIDELDSIAPSRDRSHVEAESRVVATLLTLMDGINSLSNVVVVGTTNRLDAIDPALRREGRFGTELRIGAPDLGGRRAILQIHTRRMPVANDVDLAEIALMTTGFVGADLAQVCREAAYAVLREVAQGQDLNAIQNVDLLSLTVAHRHFLAALKSVRPSALRDFAVEHPKEDWADIVGLEEVKERLRNLASERMEMQKSLQLLGVLTPPGVCLEGPMGTGKTMLARAMAAHMGAALIRISGSEFSGQAARDCERFIQGVFAKAREAAPTVVLYEDLDMLGAVLPFGISGLIAAKTRSELDALAGVPVVLVATVRDARTVEPLLFSQSCIGLQLKTGLPKPTEREEMFGVFLASCQKPDDLDLHRLGDMSDGLSGAQIQAACARAISSALREAHGKPDHAILRQGQLEYHVSELLAVNSERLTKAQSREGMDLHKYLTSLASILSRAAAVQEAEADGE